MALRDLIIQSQLVPPRNRQGILNRERISQLLSEILDYPLTIVQAGTGYGKSTELAKMAGLVPLFYWYSVREADRDAFLFLANLFASFSQLEHEWGQLALDSLENDPQTVHKDLLRPLLNEITLGLRGEAILVLDDFHLVADIPEIEELVTYLIDYSPPGLHIVLSSRKIPNYKALPRWRVKGAVKIINRTDLAFTKEEVLALFRDQYHYNITSDQANRLLMETEGWAIALQMVWQNLQSGSESVDHVLRLRPITLEALFDYLATEVLERLSSDMQDFLVTAAVLNQIEPEILNVLLGMDSSEQKLRFVQESGLFISSVGEDVYQFQNLFHDFLKSRLWSNPEKAKLLHRQSADYFLQKERYEAAIYHLLEAEDFKKAGNLIVQIGPNMIFMGRLDGLLAWIQRLPEDVINQIAGILLLKGDVFRLRSNFEESLSCYAKSEEIYTKEDDLLGRSKALRGQAQIFLDTVRPIKAEALLEEALRLLEPQEFHQETAALLDQLAENKLNLGHPDQAQALHHEARLLRNESDPGDVYLEARALLRTGHLTEGRNLLISRAMEEQHNNENRPQRFHRETLLLLSLICIMQGDWTAAKRYAEDGIEIGKKLNSSFVEAVGMIRLAHALELYGMTTRQTSLLEEAENLYNTAINKVRLFKVTRVQVEPFWGLSRLYGFQGKLLEAQEYANQAMQSAEQAGDKWLYNLVKVNLGASYSMVGNAKEALDLLFSAYDGFKKVADSYGVAASLLWILVTYWNEGDSEQARSYLRQLIPLLKAGKYENLLIKPTYLGLKDSQNIIPILLDGFKNGMEKDFLDQILRKLNVDDLEYHPGYSLYVQMLGVFEVRRGDHRIRSAEWQRDKARQLFQLFLTQPDEWLQRDQIVDRLWPELAPDAAVRDFKVALNALNRALEPSRPRGTQPFFIIRRDNLYGINPQAEIYMDVSEFEVYAEKDDVQSKQEALRLYKGEFLADSLYNEWSDHRREQIKQKYLFVCESLAEQYVIEEQFDEAINLCEKILQIEPTWEASYRLMMRAYDKKDNRSQVFYTFQRCKDILFAELGVEPTEATKNLFQELCAVNLE
ncbi:MAG: hypothetical protein CL609_01370 [Anaerolineaceae bacterium]|nr:hypothetical protein [Anaerolineaceae bacterium]